MDLMEIAAVETVSTRWYPAHLKGAAHHFSKVWSVHTQESHWQMKTTANE